MARAEFLSWALSVHNGASVVRALRIFWSSSSWRHSVHPQSSDSQRSFGCGLNSLPCCQGASHSLRQLHALLPCLGECLSSRLFTLALQGTSLQIPACILVSCTVTTPSRCPSAASRSTAFLRKCFALWGPSQDFVNEQTAEWASLCAPGHIFFPPWVSAYGSMKSGHTTASQSEVGRLPARPFGASCWAQPAPGTKPHHPARHTTNSFSLLTSAAPRALSVCSYSAYCSYVCAHVLSPSLD